MVLTTKALENIANHKYVGGAYTPLDNLLNPFWYKMTDFLPMWLSPNLVTVTGLMFNMFAFGVMSWYQPTWSESVPAWVLCTASVCLWIYQTLDAMDGKQARRTSSSSPLGQLFDHGIDCFSTIHFHSMTCGILLLGNTRLTMIFLLFLQLNFFLAQWAEFHTHVLMTAIGPIGVTEIQFTLMGLGLAGAWFDLSYFTSSQAVPEFLQVFLGPSCSLGQQIMLLFCCTGLVTFPYTLATTLLQAAKQGQVKAAVSQLLPIAMMIGMSITWPTAVYTDHIRLVTIATGVLIVLLTNVMIVFSMAQQQYPVFHLEMVPYTVVWALTQAMPSVVHEPYFFWVLVCLVVLTSLLFWDWVTTVIDEICTKLKIQIFRITTKKIS